MPYIKQTSRSSLDEPLVWLIERIIYVRNTYDISYSASLNYCIIQLLRTLFKDRYDAYKDAIGTLEAIKLEYYRRYIAPYEDRKKDENGDV